MNESTVTLCLVLHNHQPVGNFDGVIEQAYQDSYLPFLDVFEPYSELRISLHTSGPLIEWMHEHHPEYLDRISQLVREERIEIVGGPFYEPIMTMIPARDRIGQIRTFREWLSRRLGADVRGIWTPERVWEQHMVESLAEAGVQYTVLDDYHFKAAGLTDDQLTGQYITEHEGRLLTILPGSERLRYLIPFRPPEMVIDYCREIASKHDNAILVFGDDGEKFGTWPDTKKHVYENGWLRRFFDLLTENRHWLKTTTAAAAIDSHPPVGKVYLPDCSYREMTEWSLPTDRLTELDHLSHEMEHDPRWSRLKMFIKGGFWRNFKIKYPETSEMYARMMQISRRLEALVLRGDEGPTLDQARTELYRGQCNCPYWHGAFGGIYLPHLRHAIYEKLIEADNLLDRVEGRTGPYVMAHADDFNLDGRQEVMLASDRLCTFFAPAQGGMMYELDLRTSRLNLLSTLQRRREAYHAKVLAGPTAAGGDVASIHDRVVFKQEGLDKRVQYDDHPRKTLQDHFYDLGTTLDEVMRGSCVERGDFLSGPYDARLRKNPDRIQVLLTRMGRAFTSELRITKGISLEAGSDRLEIAYRIENLPPGSEFLFAVEFNFAGLPANADQRFFYQNNRESIGHLGTCLDLTGQTELGLTDEWLGVDCHLSMNRPTDLWTFPVETVSQSESGFELVHQSVAVLPHWRVRPDRDGRWEVVIKLDLMGVAEKRIEDPTRVHAAD